MNSATINTLSRMVTTQSQTTPLSLKTENKNRKKGNIAHNILTHLF